MDLARNEVIEKAEQILMSTGLAGLTMHNLATALGVEDNQLFPHLTKDDDILLMLLLGFEDEINDLVKDPVIKGATPITELRLLFKGLYQLFQHKSYYLSIILDKDLKSRNDDIENSYTRIKTIAENRLTTIIDTGKKENTIKSKHSTRLLVVKILSGFRSLIKDEQLVNEMIHDLKTLRTTYD